MTKYDLITSASHVLPPSEATGALLTERVETCAQLLTASMRMREDFIALIGEHNESLAEAKHSHHFRYIATLASLYDPISFVENVIWGLRTYMSKGFSPLYWDVMVPEAKSIAVSQLPHSAGEEISRIYDWLIHTMPQCLIVSRTTPSFFETLNLRQEE